MYKNLMYICFQNDSLSLAMTKKNEKIHSCIKEFKYHYHEVLKENGKMYGYEITQK
jgi:hypothetical protein